jgi:hypothetical protein
MRRVATLLSTAAVVLWTAGVLAQAPNLSGKWTLVPDPNAAAGGGGGGGRGGRGGGGGGGCGMECTITMDATSMKIERMAGENTITMTYKLDGSESKNSMPGRQGGAPTELVSKATVAGGKVTVKTTTGMGETTAVYSLEGGNLVVETTTPGREGGAPTTRKQTYKKG